MILKDYHVHTCLCDGKSEPEEIVLAAIEKGMETIGFSMHSFVEFDLSIYDDPAALEEYKKEITRLKEKYKDKIKILCGIEQDTYSEPADDFFDYIIGSVHYFKVGEEYYPVDLSADILRDLAKKHFCSDMYALVERYYEDVEQVVEKTGADIIGHIDLICKLNADGALFDENHPRYLAASRKAVETLLTKNKIFEINTGGISRGYQTRPYPSDDLLKLIYKKGGKILLTSDSHRKDTLCFEFEKWAEHARKIGFDI